jgi:hypothetical protein
VTIPFSEAIEQSTQPRSLLIGKGFSIAQAGAQFSYATLLDKAGLQPNNPIKNVFTTLDTVDFELVMQALQHAAQIEDVYRNPDRGNLFRKDAAAVREALIHAVREVIQEFRSIFRKSNATAAESFCAISVTFLRSTMICCCTGSF